MLNRLRYGTAIVALVGATSFAMAAANNQPAPANNAPQNQTQQQSSSIRHASPEPELRSDPPSSAEAG